MKFSAKLFVVLIIGALVATYFEYLSTVNAESDYVEHINTLHAERIEHVLAEKIIVTNILKDIIAQTKGKISQEELTALTKLIYKSEDHIAISLLPEGVVNLSRPVDTTDFPIGYDVFSDSKLKDDAQRAKLENRTIFIGPYTFSNGLSGISALKPVFYEENNEQVFWGFVLTALRVNNDILEHAGVLDIVDFGYEYSISADYRGEVLPLFITDKFSHSEIDEARRYDIGNAKWSFFLYKRVFARELTSYIVFVAFGYIGLAFILYLYVDKLEDKLELIHEMSLLDPLTKLKNRKGLHTFVENSENLEKGVTLFYLDLNKFKPINDTFGHEAGDKLLVAFAGRLAGNFPKDTFIVRLGGDEFLIIVPKLVSEGVCDQIKKRVLNFTEQPFYIDGCRFEISTSIGVAQYPNDGSTFDEVLAIADHNMFADKEERHAALLSGR